MNQRAATRTVPKLDEPVVVNAESGPTSPRAAQTRSGCVLLCPGQGAQAVGMGRAWTERYPLALRTFEEAEEVLGLPLRDCCFQGPAERLNRTDIAQVAIYVTTVAAFRALRAEGGIGPAAAIAGLSLGELTALHLAGAYDFVAGLRLVRLRGEAMQQAAELCPGGMVALVGADESQAEQLCLSVLDRLSGSQELLVPANYNCPGQLVLSGTRQACEMAVAVAAEMGLAARALAVAGAFHSPLMAPAARKLAAALNQLAWSEPQVAVLSNVTGRPHDLRNVESIKGLLVEQLTRPVLWEAAIRWVLANLPANERRAYVELAPGRVLAGLMRRIDRRTTVTSLAEPT